MRPIIRWFGVVVVAQVLLALLLKPITGDNKIFVAAAVLIVGNFLWVELCRMRRIEVDRLLFLAMITYTLAFAPLWSIIGRWMLQMEPGAPAWLSQVAYPVVYLVILFLVTGFTLMLLRLSFSATEIYESVLRGGLQPWRGWTGRSAAQPNSGPK
jgi:hypothetical protein